MRRTLDVINAERRRRCTLDTLAEPCLEGGRVGDCHIIYLVCRIGDAYAEDSFYDALTRRLVNTMNVFLFAKSCLGQQQIYREISGGAQGGITKEFVKRIRSPALQLDARYRYVRRGIHSANTTRISHYLPKPKSNWIGSMTRWDFKHSLEILIELHPSNGFIDGISLLSAKWTRISPSLNPASKRNPNNITRRR